MRQTGRFVTLDGLRGVAAVCVVLMHVAPGLGAAWAPNAGFAVDIFFCLSGFVLATAFDGPAPAGDFLRRRWARLYPLYAVGLGLGFAVHVWAAALGAPVSGAATALAALAAGVLFLPVLFPVTTGFGASFSVGWPYPFNPPAWSLFYELAVNALFARLHPRGRRLAFCVALFAALFVAFTLAARAMDGLSPFASGAPRALFEFYAGVALRELHDAGRLPRWRWQGWTPLSAAVAASFAVAPQSWLYVLYILVVAPVMVALCVADPPNRVLARLYAFGGRISFPLYALHWPLFKLGRLAFATAFGLPLTTPSPMIFFLIYATALILLCAAMAAVEPRMRAAMLARPSESPARRKAVPQCDLSEALRLSNTTARSN